jgi:hypothetical protein
MAGKVRTQSPEVIAYAEQHKLDLAAVAGSGPDGRIEMKDVVAARQTRFRADLTDKLGIPFDSSTDSIYAAIETRHLANCKALGLPSTTPYAEVRAAVQAHNVRVEAARAQAERDRAALAGVHAPTYATPARGPAYALNPLVDRVRAEASAGKRKMPTASAAPTLFASGDLPTFTASGIDPKALLEVPAAARHAMAAAATPAEAYEISRDCQAADSALEYELHPGNAEYQKRVVDWVEASITDEDMEAMFRANPIVAGILGPDD